jgi:hypothetical protein
VSKKPYPPHPRDPKKQVKRLDAGMEVVAHWFYIVVCVVLLPFWIIPWSIGYYLEKHDD